jgi:hypothetical protein
VLDGTQTLPHLDMVTLYVLPSPAVQATLACVGDKEFYDFIQQSDEGAHAPMLLSVLDLFQWTTLMNAVTADKEAGKTRLKQAHQTLAAILDADEQDLEEASRNTRAVEAYLRTTNPHEVWTEEISLPTVNLNDDSTGSNIVQLYPLLSRLNIAPSYKTTIEDLSESIHNTHRRWLVRNWKHRIKARLSLFSHLELSRTSLLIVVTGPGTLATSISWLQSRYLCGNSGLV